MGLNWCLELASQSSATQQFRILLNFQQRKVLLLLIVTWFYKLPSFTDSVKQQRTYLFCRSPAGICFCHSMYIVFCSSFLKSDFYRLFLHLFFSHFQL